MDLLIIENDPRLLGLAIRQFPGHRVTAIASSEEFFKAYDEDKNFISRFDAVLSSLCPSIVGVDEAEITKVDKKLLEHFSSQNEIGTFATMLAFCQQVPYVGLFSYGEGKKIMLSAIFKGYGTNNFIGLKEPFTTVRVRQTYFGIMEIEGEKNWAALLESLLVSASGN